jgi:hypothetical protein
MLKNHEPDILKISARVIPAFIEGRLRILCLWLSLSPSFAVYALVDIDGDVRANLDFLWQ